MKVTREEELLRSCRVLFGPEAEVGWDFLLTIPLAGIKQAFRKKALLTHPDRSHAASPTAGGPCPQLFIEVREAYEHLVDFARRRHTLSAPYRKRAGRAAPAARRTGRRKSASGKTSFFYRGALPHRRLLFGEFLFYSGEISWESLIRALVDQRLQRPKFGDFASAQGWASPQRVREVALGKRLGVPIGEAMVRSGVLSRRQVEAILSRQRRQQRALGWHFVSRGYLGADRMHLMLVRMHRHNIRYRAGCG